MDYVDSLCQPLSEGALQVLIPERIGVAYPRISHVMLPLGQQSPPQPQAHLSATFRDNEAPRQTRETPNSGDRLLPFSAGHDPVSFLVVYLRLLIHAIAILNPKPYCLGRANSTRYAFDSLSQSTPAQRQRTRRSPARAAINLHACPCTITCTLQKACIDQPSLSRMRAPKAPEYLDTLPL